MNAIALFVPSLFYLSLATDKTTFGTDSEAEIWGKRDFCSVGKTKKQSFIYLIEI